ncbi:hypothetical protein NL676_033880 [Syzygium grande]|nr:hypothetical protein NL676_033880 [Syzygium grande]
MNKGRLGRGSLKARAWARGRLEPRWLVGRRPGLSGPIRAPAVSRRDALGGEIAGARGRSHTGGLTCGIEAAIVEKRAVLLTWVHDFLSPLKVRINHIDG